MKFQSSISVFTFSQCFFFHFRIFSFFYFPIKET